MGDFPIIDPRSGDRLIFEIAGNRPTAEEASDINRILLQEEIPVVVQPPRSSFTAALTPQNIRDLRPAVVGGAATLGTFAGGALGAGAGGVGAVPGGVLGGTLGAAGGQQIFEALQEAGRATGLVGEEGILGDAPEQRTGGVLGSTQRGLQEAALEAGGQGLVRGLPMLRAGLRRGIAGVGPEGRRVTAAAQELGVGLGVEDVTTRGGIRGFRKVLGRFPIISRPFSRADERKGIELAEGLNRQLMELGPSVSVAETGVNLHRAVRGRFNGIKSSLVKGYDELFDDIRTAGIRVPSQNVRQVSSEVAESIRSSRPMMRIGEGEKSRLVPIPKPIANKVDEFVQNLSAIEGDLTIDQHKALVTDIGEIMDLSKTQGLPFKDAFRIKKALELDLQSIEDPSMLARLGELNARWASLFKLADTPTASRFTRVDRNIFGQGFEQLGSTDADRLARTAFVADSPQAIADLRKLAGPRRFREVVRVHLDRGVDQAIEQSKDGVFLNVNSLRRVWGLNKTQKAQRAGLEVALEGTGVSVGQLENFIDVLEAASSNGTINVSQFIARRATLGGVQAIARGLLPGMSLTGAASAAGGGFLGSNFSLWRGAVGLAMAMTVRRMATVATNPAFLRAATTAFNPNLPRQQRNAALIRFAQLAGRHFGSESKRGILDLLKRSEGSIESEGENR